MKKTFLFSSIILKRLVFSFVFLSSSLLVYGQSQNPLHTIRIEFDEGKLDFEEAISKQLEIVDIYRDSNNHLKCGVPLFALINRHKELVPDDLNSRIKTSFNTTSALASKSFISASGKFIIFYETTGNDAVPSADANGNSVPDYVEWVAEASDYSYDYEVNTLGFKDIIPEGAQYRVTIADGGAYGFTFPSIGAPGGTEISIENDFDGFPPNDDPDGHQIGAVRATMAHELKHAIQYAQNGWDGDSDRWAEMDATLMEEVVYDQVNDYYNYIDGFSSDLFSSPSTSLIPGSYEDITWALYFHEKYGETFWTNTWNIIENQPSTSFFSAIEQELSRVDAFFKESVLESYMWHFASGDSFSSSSYGFDESAFYPGPSLTETFEDFMIEQTSTFTSSRFSAKYFLMSPTTLSSGFVRFDYTTSSSEVQIGLLLYLKNGDIEPYFITSTTSGLSNSLKTDWKWDEVEKIGIILLNTSTNSSENFSFLISDYFITGIDTVDTIDQFKLAQNFPNPFNPSTVIQVTVPSSQKVSLVVYNILGEKVQTLADGVLGRGFHTYVFSGVNLPSGTYYYALKSENKLETKKMMLIK